MDRGKTGQHSQHGRSNGDGEFSYSKIDHADSSLHSLENISMLIPEDHAALHLEQVHKEVLQKESLHKIAETKLPIPSNKLPKITEPEINFIKQPEIKTQEALKKTAENLAPLNHVIKPENIVIKPEFQREIEKLVNSHYLDEQLDQSARFRLQMEEEILLQPVVKKVKKIVEEKKEPVFTPQKPIQPPQEFAPKFATNKTKEAFYEKVAEETSNPVLTARNSRFGTLEKSFKTVTSRLHTRRIKGEIPSLDEPVIAFTKWWREKVALAFPIEEAKRLGSAFIFNRENEEQEYYFVPYPMEQALRNSLPEEWRDFDAETAWGVATVAGCTGVILTFWLLLYWMTPERRLVLKQNQAFENDESIASAILNIQNPEPQVQTQVIIHDVQKPIFQPPPVVPQPVDNPFFKEPEKKPLSFGYPDLGITRERIIYQGAPQHNLHSDYVWKTKSEYYPRNMSMLPAFTADTWSRSQNIPGRFQLVENTFHLMPLIKRWSPTLASASLVAFRNAPLEQTDIHQLPSTGFVNPIVNLSQPRAAKSGVYQAKLKVLNQSHLTPIEVTVRAGNSNMYRVLDTSPGLKDVNENGLTWHSKALFPNMTNEYRVVQQSGSNSPITRSVYEIEVSTQVAALTKVGNLGVSLDMVSQTIAKTGDYVTMTINLTNRTPLAIRNAMLKVELPKIVEHLRGNIIERNIEEIAAGGRQQIKLTVLAKDIGSSQINAILIKSQQKLAQDRELITIQQGNKRDGDEFPKVPTEKKPTTFVTSRPTITPAPTTTYTTGSCGCFFTTSPLESAPQISGETFFEYH
jgi:hypothetical protein